MSPHVGARITRNEDPALLRGRGLFVDDVRLPGMVGAAVLRSPHAHARINRIDARPARAASNPGGAPSRCIGDTPPFSEGEIPL